MLQLSQAPKTTWDAAHADFEKITDELLEQIDTLTSQTRR